jgi:hypothetical protein
MQPEIKSTISRIYNQVILTLFSDNAAHHSLRFGGGTLFFLR